MFEWVIIIIILVKKIHIINKIQMIFIDKKINFKKLRIWIIIKKNQKNKKMWLIKE